MSAFILDPRLDADTTLLGRMGICRVLLMNDARYPWLILVPERNGLADLIDLTPEDEAAVWKSVRAVSEALKSITSPVKLNVGALGNVVRQLHIHILARYESDEAWPGPVWGKGTARPYEEAARDALIAALRKALPELIR
ncbi:HIT domain-containing protein [Lacibacterium aquatile]|uniref:HIT domain-containing protein n=1 Tax=Lacibacterium aquatile TaxID=1168082 RepID=A0ABW5DZQ0_9PROT